MSDHQCVFQHKISTTDQILEKKWEYNGRVYQLFIYSEQAYNSIRTKVLYNILNEFGISMKLVRLIRMCLNKTYSKVRTGKNLMHLVFTMV